MRKNKNLSPLLLGAKLLLVLCLLITNETVVCVAKSSNNNDGDVVMRKMKISDWGSVVLSEKWQEGDVKGDTVRFVLNDHSASLKFYPLKGVTSKGEMKNFLITRAKENRIPTFYRTVGNSQLENVNAENGGFVQGTREVKPQKENTIIQGEDSTFVVRENEDEKSENHGLVQYIVIAGLQNKNGVFILEATTTSLEDVPMSISRAQRSWLLR